MKNKNKQTKFPVVRFNALIMYQSGRLKYLPKPGADQKDHAKG